MRLSDRVGAPLRLTLYAKVVLQGQTGIAHGRGEERVLGPFHAPVKVYYVFI
jgi:hypothetical protein